MTNLFADVNSFTHLFPEWALSWALKRSTEEDPTLFWQYAICLRGSPTANGYPLSQLLGHIPLPALKYERPFLKGEYGAFGIPKEDYQKRFWGLRPDFVVESSEHSVFLILEAKGGQVADSIWKNPKEILYYRFLQSFKSCKTKGFFYIIPCLAVDSCAQCLSDQFSEDQSIFTGLITWEQLLPVIYDRLMETALDQVIREMEGLKVLRSWRK
jgi:hypothetical protein